MASSVGALYRKHISSVGGLTGGTGVSLAKGRKRREESVLAGEGCPGSVYAEEKSSLPLTDLTSSSC